MLQLLRRDVDQGDFRGQIEHAVRHGLLDRHAGDLGHYILDALEMLDVDGGVDVDAGGQQLLDVLPAFFVAGAGGVGMGQLVDQDDLRLSLQRRIDIQLRQAHPLVFALGLGDGRQPFEQLVGLRPAVGLDVGGDHV
ncbi:MAG: hypothetical protein ACD_75C00116G0001, partial [uncultured bacterium]